MKKKLLIDHTSSIKMPIQESSEDGRIFVEGEFARADVPTANGRIYPRKIWEKCIANLNKAIAERKVFGEIEHPETGKTSLKRVSHLITGLSINEEGVIKGRAEIMDTPDGKTIKAMRSSNASVGVSSRGFGSVVQKEGYDVVQDDFSLMTFDFVADPAMGSAYPEFSKEESNISKDKEVLSEETQDQKQEVSSAEQEDPTPTQEPVLDQLVLKEPEMSADEAIKEAVRLLKIVKDSGDFEKIAVAEKAIAELQLAEIEDDEEEENLGEALADSQDTKSDVTESKDSIALEKDAESVLKQLSFSLFAHKKLSQHPDLNRIIESFDYENIPDIESLDAYLKPFVREMKVFQVKKMSESRSLQEEINILRNKVSSLEKDLSSSTEIAHKAAMTAYFESRVSNLPSAPEARKLFRQMNLDTKTKIDSLVESFVKAPTSERFQEIKSSFGKTKVSEFKSNLVEEAIKNSSISEEEITEDFSRFKKLSGIE